MPCRLQRPLAAISETAFTFLTKGRRRQSPTNLSGYVPPLVILYSVIQGDDTRSMARVFISYKRNAEPDESFSARAFGAFREDGHEVFIDRAMKVGTPWAEEIEANVRQSDFLIILLTSESSQSEMVRGEVEIARNEAVRRGGKPRILPVRLAFEGRLPYPLSSYLDPLQYLVWSGESATERVLQELRAVLTGRELSLPSDFVAPTSPASTPPEHSANLPSKLPPPGGTM